MENESDIGSGKIYATGIVGTWALMAMIGSTDVLSGLDVKVVFIFHTFNIYE